MYIVNRSTLRDCANYSCIHNIISKGPCVLSFMLCLMKEDAPYIYLGGGSMALHRVKHQSHIHACTS